MPKWRRGQVAFIVTVGKADCRHRCWYMCGYDSGVPKSSIFLTKCFSCGSTVLPITPFRTSKHFTQKQGCLYIKQGNIVSLYPNGMWIFG